MIVCNLPSEDNSDPREGERLRDEALSWLRRHRPALIRLLQRAFLCELLSHGSATSDVLRKAVPIPRGVDPRVVGSAVRGLAEQQLIVSVGRRKSRRPQAHARKLDVWAVGDKAKARHWLATHPEIDPPDEPGVPALV